MGIRTFGIALLAASALGISSGPGHAETVIRFNNFLPPTHMVVTDILLPWAAAVQEKTKGRVRVELTKTSLAAPPRQFDIVTEGIADAALSIAGYTPTRFPVANVLELPFLGPDSESISVAYWRTYKSLFEKAGEFHEVKLIGLMGHGPGQIFTRRPVANIEDYDGRKIRVAGKVLSDTVTALGGVPVNAPATRSYEMLSTGVVDGSAYSIDSVVSFKAEDFVKHAVMIPDGLFNTSFYVILNKKVWEKLSAEDRDAIDGVSGEAFARMAGKAWDKADRDARKTMESKGTVFVTPSEAFMSAVRSRLARIEGEWIESVKAQGVDGTAALKMLRAEATGFRK